MLKTETFTMRIKPEVKAALNELAALDGRTASAWIEAVVREKSKKMGAEIKPSKKDST
jgi:hypothetical protein